MNTWHRQATHAQNGNGLNLLDHIVSDIEVIVQLIIATWGMELIPRVDSYHADTSSESLDAISKIKATV